MDTIWRLRYSLKRQKGDKMHMSYVNYGLRDMDGEFLRMLEVKKACDRARISYPKEVEAYFGAFCHKTEEVLKKGMLKVHVEFDQKVSPVYDLRTIQVQDIPEYVKTICFEGTMVGAKE